MRRWLLEVGVVALLLLGSACSSTSGEGPEAGAMVDSLGVPVEDDAQEKEPDYTVYLTGVVSDTLSGRAYFGSVLITDTTNPFLVIDLQAGGDFTGGFFIVFDSTGLPSQGVLDLAPQSDTTDTPSGTRIIYRRGLIVDLRSTRGDIEFTTVSDTLIAGTIDAVLSGRDFIDGTEVSEVELTARGEFKARPGRVGYILGL